MHSIFEIKQLNASTLGKILFTFKKELWLALIVSAVINLLMLAPTIYMLQIFDRVMISKSTFSLAVVSVLVLLAYSVMAISELLRSKLIISSGIRLDHALNEPLFRATFLDQLRSGGRNPAQAFADLNVVRQWLTGSGLFAFLDLPWTPIYVAVMFLLHPLLGFMTIGFMLILAVFAYLSTKFAGDSVEESEEEERELNKFLHSKLRNAEVIEAHGMAKNFRRIWQQKQIEMLKVQVVSADINERISATSKQLRFFLNSLALGAGALLVIKGEISIGAMVAAGLLMAKATSPIDMIVSGWRGLLAVKKSLSRLEAQLKLVDRKSNELVVDRPSGTIELVNISALISDCGPAILSSISGVFEAGKIYVIVGPSGAGKSTLGKVILGIWPTTKGEILFDGQEIRSLSREALGPFVGYLPQDVELFQGSVASNIARMGNIDSALVIEAAKNAQIHEFILSLPRGYDTDIGENGSALSGGERQRLALARAIYGSPKLVVLDEPNANLDARGDAALKSALIMLKAGGSSIFLISHRPEVLEFADAVLAVSLGKMTHFGSFAEYQSSMNVQSNNVDPPYFSPAAKSLDAASAASY